MAAVCALLACDSENVQWAFISNPSGGAKHPGGGAIVVIRKTSPALVTESGGSLRQTGTGERGSMTVHVAIHADMVALEHEDAIELRCPVLPDGGVLLPGAQMQVLTAGPVNWVFTVPDSGVIDSAAVGRGRLLAAATSNVLALQHGTGLILFGSRDDGPEQLGLDYQLEESGAHLRLLLPGQPPRDLVGAPRPAVEDRLAFDDQRDSVRIFGPYGDPIAELPRAAVSLPGGAHGVFLRGTLPDGLPSLPRPFAVVMATDNRYLLRIE